MEASGLGMPAGPVSQAAEDSVTQTNVPQQVQGPQSFDQFAGPGPASTNQTTTKPRQMPGDGGGPGMDPASNGADVESGEPTQESDGADPKPPTQAAKHGSYLLADLMADIRRANPGLAERDTFHLAKRVIDEYPLTKQAETWSPLSFGNRGRVPDGPLTMMLHKKIHDAPGPGHNRPKAPLAEPGQPEAEPKSENPALEGTIVEPKGLPPAPLGIEKRKPRTMVLQPDGQHWDWDRPDPWEEQHRGAR